MNKKAFFASLGLIFTTMIWGFAFVVVKNSLEVLPPIYMIAFRFTISVPLLCIIFWRKLSRISKKSLIHGGILGIFLFLAYAFQTIGCEYTTAGKNAFLTTTYVMIVPFLTWIFSKIKPAKVSVAAAVIALVGIGFLSLESDTQFSVNIGDFLTLICGLFYALHMVFISKYTAKEDPILLTIIQLSITAILGWIAAPIYDETFDFKIVSQWNILNSILYLGLFSTMLGFLLQNVCQKIVRPSTTSLILSFEAVFGVLSSVIFLHEKITLRMFIGCILIFTALLISETNFFKAKKK